MKLAALRLGVLRKTIWVPSVSVTIESAPALAMPTRPAVGPAPAPAVAATDPAAPATAEQAQRTGTADHGRSAETIQKGHRAAAGKGQHARIVHLNRGRSGAPYDGVGAAGRDGAVARAQIENTA